ncbi:MAG: TolB family protein [Anaerolineales bacterium]
MKLSLTAPLLALSLFACQVRISEITPAGAPAATLPPSRPTATLAPTSETLSSSSLTGRLLYTQGAEGLWEIDFDTGASGQLWELPERAFLGGITASPDGTQLVLAYAEPPPEGTPQLGATSIFLADQDGANLQPLLERTVQYESFINPVWSHDGRWLYFTHSRPLYDENDTITGISMNIERVAFDGSAPEVIIESSQQPAVSHDVTRIVYILFNFETFGQSLWAADADGGNAVELVSGGAFFALAGPRISPDGQRVVFAASGELADASSGLMSELIAQLAAPAAEAHGPPWELWSVPIAGGELTQLTNLATDSPWPAWSPDGQHIALVYPGGVALLQDGDPVLLAEATQHGEMVWTP